jgi:hypothetical protein
VHPIGRQHDQLTKKKLQLLPDINLFYYTIKRRIVVWFGHVTSKIILLETIKGWRKAGTSL